MNELTFEASRVIRAPIERVFLAWTEESMLEKWFPPQDPDWSCKIESNPAVGGKYRFEMIGPEDRFVVVGEYTEIVPNQKLVFSWKWESAPEEDEPTNVEVVFANHPNGTEVTLTHSGFALADDAGQHEDGWGKVLNRLETLFSNM